MQTAGSATAKKLVSFDRVLLVVVSALLLSHAGARYATLHSNDYPFLAWSWFIAYLIGSLPLPESILSVIFVNFWVLVFGGACTVILAIRFIQLRTLKSPALLSCAALLIAYEFWGADVLDWTFDEIRFQSNRSAYRAIAEADNGRRDFTVVNWGETGFLDSSAQYYLVFDRSGALARGERKPEDFGWKAEHMVCGGSIRRLSIDFYSVTVMCRGT